MSQKASASRTAMVMSRTFAIIGRLQEKWRTPGGGPRGEERHGLRRLERDRFRSGLAREKSFERLVFAEIRDGHAERVDGDQFVREVGLEYENKVRGVEIAFQFAMVDGRVIHHIEINAGAIRRGC